MEVVVAENKKIKPLHGYLLIQEIEEKEQTTKGGIVLPDTASQKGLKTGVVEALGPRVLEEKIDDSIETLIGKTILFDPRGEETIGIDDTRVFLPYQAVLAVLDDSRKPIKLPTISNFFNTPTWEDYIGTDFSGWEQYQNLTHFSVRVRFLTPFQELDELARRTHECCVDTARGIDDIDLRSIQFFKKDDVFVTGITDDYWHGGYTVDPENNYIEFQRQGVDLHNLQKTIPTHLTALANILSSYEFKKIAFDDYSRVTGIFFRFHQRLRIIGRGARHHDATNSELMQQFLLFSQQGKKTSTLDALALKSNDIGRIDMKISFQKIIDDHEYRIFVTIEAPANDEHTILDIEWEVQDLNPGNVPDRNYGAIFTTFFRDIVMRSFYKRWFQENDDIVCSSEKK